MVTRTRSVVAGAARHFAARLAARLGAWSATHDIVPNDVTEKIDAVAEQLGEDAGARRTTAQNVTTGISLLLIAGLAALILLEGYAGHDDQPLQLDVRVAGDAVERVGERYYVPVVVHNRGSRAVEEVLVTVEARDGAELVAETESVVALIGEDERVEVVLVLDQDPASLAIDAAVATFQVSGD